MSPPVREKVIWKQQCGLHAPRPTQCPPDSVKKEEGPWVTRALAREGSSVFPGSHNFPRLAPEVLHLPDLPSKVLEALARCFPSHSLQKTDCLGVMGVRV